MPHVVVVLGAGYAGMPAAQRLARQVRPEDIAAADAVLLGSTLHYLEPDSTGAWQPVTLDRAEHLSFYFCSGYDIATAAGRAVDDDIADVGCA